jgi:TIR domain
MTADLEPDGPPSRADDLPRVFISYSHRDKAQKDKLLRHFGVLDGSASIQVWTDDAIGAGREWQTEIDQALSQAAAAVLLISADFLSSPFILQKEVPALIDRWKTEGLSIFPVLAKPCAWQAVPWLTKMQLRPKDAKPVWRSGGRYVDEELKWITLELYTIVEQANKKRAQTNRDPAATTRLNEAFASQSKAVQEVLDRSREELTRQITADTQKPQMERLKILHETETKIREIMQDITPNRSLINDRMFKKWSEYIRS